MNKRFSDFLVILLLVVFLSFGLLYAINSIVTVALGPVKAQISELRAVIAKGSIRSVNLSPGAVPDGLINQQIMLLSQRVVNLDTRLNKMIALLERGPGQQRPSAPQEDMNKVYAIDVGSSPILGNKNAPVTIVEFMDLQCPYCVRFYPVIKDVVKAYPGKVRSVIKHFPLPFHQNALPSAKLAFAANEQGKYYEMIDLLLQTAGDVSEEKIKGYAKDLGLNYKKLMDDYKNKDAQYQKLIDQDKELASKVEVRGTPTFYINGKKTMARDLGTYKAEIDQILAGKK